MSLKIDYDKIITNAISALVTIVFVGAATIVWTKANGIEEAISKATAGLVEQTKKLDIAIEVIQREMIDDRDSRLNELESLQIRIKDLENQVDKLSKENELWNIPDMIPPTPIVNYKINDDMPIPLPKVPERDFIMQQIQAPQQKYLE